jgi:hypothetical protein
MAAQLPVAASQMPGPATNTIGAMQGRGRLTRALMAASPAGLAVKAPVLTLAMVAVLPAPYALLDDKVADAEIRAARRRRDRPAR